ncbi:MAG: type IV pilus twitching motility protein PilT [Proteobacteria bacterium]|nr:type IV pilus twitching motility protein PilT [Pseudomonadota bacterium]
MLRRMVEVGASDLHLVTGMPPLGRVHGKMRRLLDRPPLTHAELRELLFEVITDRAYEQFCRTNDTDFAYAIEGVARFRANYFVDRKGIAAVFRFIPFEVLRPEQIGLPRKAVDLCQLTKGMVLVTGPTGSGKSTTLASLIDQINRTRDDHIITIEDPVEFTHENKKCLVSQREVGTHTESFRSALRAALREDPDIVLVGELRDLETVSIALETAETGHLVLGTLHTTTAASTVDRIIDQFPPSQQAQIRIMLAGSLRGVIAQVLCAKRGGGRVAAYEVLLGTPAIANLIREGKTAQIASIMQTSRTLGMQSMNDQLVDLVRARTVEPEEAYLKTYDRTGLLQAFQSAGIVFQPDQA